MSINKKFLRQCICCRITKPKSDLIRITKDFKTQEIQLNMDEKIQGRSVYICKDSACVEKALKKQKIEALLKAKMPENIKEELYTVLRN